VDFWRLSFELFFGQIFVEDFSVFALNEVNQTVWSGLDGDKFVLGFQAHDWNQIPGFNRRFCRRLFFLRNGNRGPRGWTVWLCSRSDGCQDRDAGQYDSASDDDQFGFHRLVPDQSKSIAPMDSGQQAFTGQRGREMSLKASPRTRFHWGALSIKESTQGRKDAKAQRCGGKIPKGFRR